MKATAGQIKWILRLFPPLLFTRVWVLSISPDFKHCRVKVFRSLLNINLNKSIFGGTIFSAADPYYAVLFWSIFKNKGMNVQSWLKSADIKYIRPAKTNIYLDFKISDEDIAEAEESLNRSGKFSKKYQIEIVDRKQEIVAIVYTEVYLRNLGKEIDSVSNF